MLLRMLKEILGKRRRPTGAVAGDATTLLLTRLDLLREYQRNGDQTRAAEVAAVTFTAPGANSTTLRALSRTSGLDDAMRRYVDLLASGLDPQFAIRAWDELGYAYSLRGDVEQSVRAFDEALRLAPGSGSETAAFDGLYHRGLAVTQTPDSPGRRRRFFRLVGLVEQCARLEGDIAECGCWRGLSSYLICSTLGNLDAAVSGRGYHIFDSFQGLSQPTSLDGGAGFHGQFSAKLDEVRSNLSSFPDMTFHPGWIPASLAGLAERRYRFVHVDVDLFEPTDGAIRYFVPRLVSGGLLVCDDYNWPGARKAIDDYCGEMNITLTTTDANQAVIRAS
jgi:hypothetical protein